MGTRDTRFVSQVIPGLIVFEIHELAEQIRLSQSKQSVDVGEPAIAQSTRTLDG